MLAPVGVGALEHLDHAFARRPLVQIVERERHVAGGLRLCADAELGLERGEQAARLAAGVLHAQYDHRGHAVDPTEGLSRQVRPPGYGRITVADASSSGIPRS